MSQARVTDFYAQRRSSRRIGAQAQKRRKLSSSSDLLAKELAPCKKQKSDPNSQVQEFFKNIELNCKSNSIKFGPEVSFHDFTKALNAASSSDLGTKVKAPEDKPAAKSLTVTKPKPKRGGLKPKKGPPKNQKAEMKPVSTLDQYLDKKVSKVPNTETGSKEGISNLQKAKEKTPTKRGHGTAKAPIRRKKAKEASELSEESGYSSHSSLSDNQSPMKQAAAAAKRCLQDQFQASPKTADNITLIPETTGIIDGMKTGARQRVSREAGQTQRNAPEQVVNPVPSKSPMKDRIKMAMAEHQTFKESRTNLEKRREIKEKMSPEEVRAKLAKCGKLEELQAVLGKVKESAQVRKDVPKPPEEEKQPEVVPAYKKYRHLAVAAPPSLLLPGKYKTLAEMFQSMDTVVSMLHNRMEGCSFSKLKVGVQELCRKSFQPKNLGQIKTVYPSSYHLYQQKCSRPISQRGTVKNKNGGYELMVEAVLDDSACPSKEAAGSSGKSTMKDIHSQQSFLQKFTPSVLIARRTLFHSNLIDLVKQQHKDFLQKQSPPLTVPDDKITRWHPKFPLEQVCDIEPTPLPQPPDVQTYSTAKDVLDKARDLMNPKVVKALELIAQRNEEKASTEPEAAMESNKTDKPEKAAKPTKGVSSDLLQRIRAKEARQAQAAMMRSQIDEEKIGMLERLPELCLIIRGLFLAEKKAALTVDIVIKKVGDSCKASLSQGQLEKHVDLMLEILPDWIKSLKIRKETYLKIDKKKELKELTNQISQVLKAEKRK